MKKILIVDDDPTLINFLEPVFSKKNVETISAVNGLDALEKIGKKVPDLIISDIMMPKMDGYELYNKLQENPKTVGIPFIFLSSKDDPTEQLKGLRMGASEYLTKPFDLNKLVMTATEAIESAEKIKESNERIDFSGNLSEIHIENIVQLIDMNQKTGALIFLTPEGTKIGSVFFKDGEIIFASKDALEGEEAFYDLAAVKEGYVKFYIREVTVPTFIKKQTMSLLFEATRLQDEAHAFKDLATDFNVVPEINSMKIPPEIVENSGIEGITQILQMVQDKKSIGEIVNSGQMSRLVTEKILADLITYEIVKVGNDKKK